MCGVIARSSRCLKKIRVRFLALKIFDSPRRPKRFQFSFREFVRHPIIRFAVAEAACGAVATRRWVSLPLARLDFRTAKSSQNLPREISSQPRLNVSLTPRGLEILLALRCIAFVQTTLPIRKLKRSTLLGRRDQPLIMQTAPEL